MGPLRAGFLLRILGGRGFSRGSELLVRPGTGRAFEGDILDPVQAGAHSTVDAGVVSLAAPATKAGNI